MAAARRGRGRVRLGVRVRPRRSHSGSAESAGPADRPDRPQGAAPVPSRGPPVDRAPAAGTADAGPGYGRAAPRPRRGRGRGRLSSSWPGSPGRRRAGRPAPRRSPPRPPRDRDQHRGRSRPAAPPAEPGARRSGNPRHACEPPLGLRGAGPGGTAEPVHGAQAAPDTRPQRGARRRAYARLGWSAVPPMEVGARPRYTPYGPGLAEPDPHQVAGVAHGLAGGRGQLRVRD